MTARDLHATLEYDNGFVSGATMAASAATNAVTDRQGFSALEFVVLKSASTATTATVLVEVQSATATSGHTLATTNDRIGSAATMTATTAGVAKVGYIGADRYASVRVTPAAATGRYAVVVVKKPQKLPAQA